jgi:hypothetical protein
MSRRAFATILALVLAHGCATALPPEASRPAVEALAQSRFEDASREAEAVLARDQSHSRALVVRAITRYREAMHELVGDLMTMELWLFSAYGMRHRYMRWSLEETTRALAAAEADLAVAAEDPGFALELCLACWKLDLNYDRRVDEDDEDILAIEEDADGQAIPRKDPRRKPTFRFDRGDVYWARAAVAFQRALLELVLSYDFRDVDAIMARSQRSKAFDAGKHVIRLRDRQRAAGVRALLLAGLEHAERARREYLAETDDDREWVPNPRQQSHPLPLPVDDTLYATWEGLLGDLRRLALGEEGVSVSEAGEVGGAAWKVSPGGFIDVGRMLAAPADLVIEPAVLEHPAKEPALALKSLFGAAYVPAMKPTPMLKRLARMKDELDHGTETFARKLRYLLWLN